MWILQKTSSLIILCPKQMLDFGLSSIQPKEPVFHSHNAALQKKLQQSVRRCPSMDAHTLRADIASPADDGQQLVHELVADKRGQGHCGKLVGWKYVALLSRSAVNNLY
jgi:hypothetical protein